MKKREKFQAGIKAHVNNTKLNFVEGGNDLWSAVYKQQEVPEERPGCLLPLEMLELPLKTVGGDGCKDVIAPRETPKGRLGWSVSLVYYERDD